MIWSIAALYCFADLPDFADWREPLLNRCREAGIRGTLLLAPEGINGTISGDRPALEALLDWLRLDPRFARLGAKWSEAEAAPFQRLKVKLKREIVTFGQPEANPAVRVGTYVPPQQWNALISDPDVVVVDTRNDYEVQIGTFQGALDPQTEHFRQFPDYVDRELDPQQHRRVAMFCTGGIRCEKASAYLLSQGFEQVYHLEGGILRYLEEIPPEQSLWQGECFVFDERVAVGHGLEPSHTLDRCRGCGWALTPEDRLSPHYEPGICCPHCHADLTPEKRQRMERRSRG